MATPETVVEAIRARGWGQGLKAPAAGSLAGEAMAAASRVYQVISRTQTVPDDWLSHESGCEVLLKLENEQVTGSFKARGAANKVLQLGHSTLSAGLTLASSGNHALACAHACSCLAKLRGPEWETHPRIFLPDNADLGKADKLRRMGALVAAHGSDAVETEAHARQEAARLHGSYISPYNDLQVAGGQGTVAVELLQQLGPDGMDTVYVPVGGGGLIAGCASVLKAFAPGLRVVGCQPAASNVMQQSVAAGRIVQATSSDTLSDGTAGGVEENALTFQPCLDLVDEWVSVSEREIAHALLGLLDHSHLRLEGACGMTVAAFLQHRCKSSMAASCTHPVLIMCAGNVSQASFDKAKELVA